MKESSRTLKFSFANAMRPVSNVLTLDIGTSPLAQGTSALTALVEIERWTKPAPPLRAFTPPRLAAAG
jgi:biotin/methionine sulfoxide reductase